MSEPTVQSKSGMIQLGPLQLAELPMLGVVIAATFCGLVLIMLIALTFLLLLRKSGCMRRGQLKVKSGANGEHKFLQPTASMEHLELLTHDKPPNGHIPVEHDGTKLSDGAQEPLIVKDLPSPPDATDKEVSDNLNRNSWPTRNTSFKLAVDENSRVVEKYRRPNAQLIAEIDEEGSPMPTQQTTARKVSYEPRSRPPKTAEKYNRSTDSLSARKRDVSRERILTSSPEGNDSTGDEHSSTRESTVKRRPNSEEVSEMKTHGHHKSSLRKSGSEKHKRPSPNHHDDIDIEQEERSAIQREESELDSELPAGTSANTYENVTDLMRRPSRPTDMTDDRARDPSPEKLKQDDQVEKLQVTQRSSEREGDERILLSMPGIRLVDFASDRSSLPSPDGAVRVSGSALHSLPASEAHSSKTVAFKSTDDFIDPRIDLTQSPTFDDERAYNRYSGAYQAVPIPENEGQKEQWSIPVESSGRPTRLRIPPPTLPKPKYVVTRRSDGSHSDVPRGYHQPRRSMPDDHYSPTSENIHKAFNEATNPIPDGDRPLVVRSRRPRSLEPGYLPADDGSRSDEPRPNLAYGRHSLKEGPGRSQSLRYPSSSEGYGIPTGSYRVNPQEPNYPPDRDPRTDERVFYRPKNFVLGNQPYPPANYDLAKRYSDPRLPPGPIRHYPPLRHRFIGPPRPMTRFAPGRLPFPGPPMRHPLYSRHSIAEGMKPTSQPPADASDNDKPPQNGSIQSLTVQASTIPPWERSSSKLSLTEQTSGSSTPTGKPRFVPAKTEQNDNDQPPGSKTTSASDQPSHQKPPLPSNTPRMRTSVGEGDPNYMSHYQMPGYPRRVATVKPNGPMRHNSYNSLVARMPPPFMISGPGPRPVLVRPATVVDIDDGPGQTGGRSLSYKASLM